MSKSEIVDWLCSNEALTLDIINEVRSRIDVIGPFKDEATDQTIAHVQNELVNEMSKQKGWTFETVNVIIPEDQFTNYIKEVMKNG